jgi:pyridoxine 5'-phosphate synthase PdxJ
MGVASTREWPSEGFTRPWPDEITMVPETKVRVTRSGGMSTGCKKLSVNRQ